MNKEFKKINSKTETRYILETASAGSTSAGDIGSAISNLETIQRRLHELKKTVKVPTKPPRNPVGMGATPGRGTQKHVRSDRKKEKDSKKVFEEISDDKKIFIKFRLSELQNEETKIIMFGGYGNKPKDIKRQDSIFTPISIDYNDIDDTILKIKNLLSELDVEKNTKIYIDIPSYLSDILDNTKDAIETEIINDNENIELYRKRGIDNGLKRDDEEDSLHYLATHPKDSVIRKNDLDTVSAVDSEKEKDNDNIRPVGDKLVIPTSIEGNRFIRQLVSKGILDSNEINLVGNIVYIKKEDFETVKKELKKIHQKDIDIHKYFPVKKIMRESKESDHEISMARNELKSIIADAKKIMSKLKKYSEEEGIMAWQQSKITKTADYLNSVNQSLDENKSENLKKKIKDEISEDLKKWFKEKWVRFGPDGKIRGPCARGSKSEGKPKCLPQSKAHSLGKKGRATAASRKRREDPNPERKGSAINVKTKESQQGITESSGFNQNAGIGIDGKSFKFNVKDLISFAEKYPVKEIDPTQFKSQLDSRDEDPNKSMDRSKKADLQYPIIVVKRKNNSLWIADGTHRAQKAIMNDIPTIKAKIIPIDDMDQFLVNKDKSVDESCWDTHKQIGMKKKGSKLVPNCVPKEGKI